MTHSAASSIIRLASQRLPVRPIRLGHLRILIVLPDPRSAVQSYRPVSERTKSEHEQPQGIVTPDNRSNPFEASELQYAGR
jgi:hypothetical protein